MGFESAYGILVAGEENLDRVADAFAKALPRHLRSSVSLEASWIPEIQRLRLEIMGSAAIDKSDLEVEIGAGDDRMGVLGDGARAVVKALRAPVHVFRAWDGLVLPEILGLDRAGKVTISPRKDLDLGKQLEKILDAEEDVRNAPETRARFDSLFERHSFGRLLKLLDVRWSWRALPFDPHLFTPRQIAWTRRRMPGSRRWEDETPFPAEEEIAISPAFAERLARASEHLGSSDLASTIARKIDRTRKPRASRYVPSWLDALASTIPTPSPGLLEAAEIAGASPGAVLEYAFDLEIAGLAKKDPALVRLLTLSQKQVEEERIDRWSREETKRRSVVAEFLDRESEELSRLAKEMGIDTRPSMDRVDPAALGLEPERPTASLIGDRIERHKKVASTAALAQALALEGAEEGTAVVAGEQTRGTARHGRAWFSARGNLHLSVMLRPEIPSKSAAIFTPAMALGLSKAIEEVTDLPAKLKWPNDVLVNGRKVAAALTHALSRNDVLEAVIVSVMVNVGAAPPTKGLRAPSSTLSAEAKRVVSLAEVERAVLAHLEEIYESIQLTLEVEVIGRGRTSQNGPFRYLRHDWNDRCLLRDCEIVLDDPSGNRIEGIACGIGEDGALIVSTRDGFRAVLSGDLVSVAKKRERRP